MKTIEIDLETRSDRDITKCGVYAYADSPYFAITLMSVAIDDGTVQLYDLANGDRVPDEILSALTDESVIKRAFNVQFERVCLSRYLREEYPQIFRSYSIDADTVGDYLSPVGWQCTMIHCRALGLPSTLASAGAALKLEQQKMPEGKALIKYFCVPYDTVDSVPQFHTPADAPEKWETFKAYNKQDVEAELAIDQRLSRFPVPDFIWEQFYLDQEINDRGIRVDMELVEAALTLDAQAKATLSAEMRRLTGIENPNSVYQLLEWLKGHGYKSDCLDKAAVRELLKTPGGTYDLAKGLNGWRATDPTDLITKVTAVVPNEEGRQIWEDALQVFFCGDQSLIDYVQMICGLCLIGKVYTEAMIIAYGDGRNGKSTFWNVIYKVLGSYSGNISADALTVNCKTDADIANWNKGKIPVALIQPSSAGHGLNLQDGGSTIIWYTMPWSLELYQQTNARLWRQGQQSETVVIHHLVAAGTIDEDIMKVLENKDKTQAAMMKAVKARVRE